MNSDQPPANLKFAGGFVLLPHIIHIYRRKLRGVEVIGEKK